MKPPCANRQAGFTLLEILVALVVFGFLMAGLTQAVRFGMTAWAAQARMIDRDGDLDAVDRVLRTLLEQVEPGRPVDPPNIVGTATSFAFTSILPAGASALPSRRADMLLRVDPGGRLVLRWTPHLHVKRLVPVAPPTTTDILAGVVRVEFSYFSPDGGWRGQWNGRTPPELIKLRIVFARDDPRHWPDIVAAPQRRREDG